MTETQSPPQNQLPPAPGGRRRRRRHVDETSSAQIELSPLIDMVFILLIFFVVTTTFERQRALPLNTPQSSTASLQDPGALIISVAANGQLQLDGIPLGGSSLPDLRRTLASRSNRTVLIEADGAVRTDVITRLMDGARAAGASEVALVTAAPSNAGGGQP